MCDDELDCAAMDCTEPQLNTGNMKYFPFLFDNL
jgi:hypothetical protein